MLDGLTLEQFMELSRESSKLGTLTASSRVSVQCLNDVDLASKQRKQQQALKRTDMKGGVTNIH